MAWRRSVLALLLVILQVKGILIYIAQSDLLPAWGEKRVRLATRSFPAKGELERLTLRAG